jgi:hypothetical protein
MRRLKLLSAALFAAAVIATPAMAQGYYVRRPAIDAYAAAPVGPYLPYGYRGYSHSCVPAPRVGSFAGDPWTYDVACLPGTTRAY